DIRIRAARPADAGRLAELMVTGLQTRFQLLGLPFVTLLHEYMAESPHCVCLVAEHGGRVVGYASALVSVRDFYRHFANQKGLRAFMVSLARCPHPKPLHVLWQGLASPSKVPSSDPQPDRVSVVVRKEVRGRGAARRLARGVADRMRVLKVPAMTIKTGAN